MYNVYIYIFFFYFLCDGYIHWLFLVFISQNNDKIKNDSEVKFSTPIIIVCVCN